MKLIFFFIGILLYPLNRLINVRRGYWLFGAQHGQSFIDNSKYFYEYMLEYHPEQRSYWITQSRRVVDQLKKESKPVVHNLSLRGIWMSLIAQYIVISTSRNDVLYARVKRNRRIIELWHGMPMKKILHDHQPHRPEQKSIKGLLWDKFVATYQHSQVDFIPATSDYFVPIMQSAFQNKNVFVTGQPRTDVFYLWEKSAIKKKHNFDFDDRIVTYMPTHRSYGKGLANPRIFEANPEALHRLDIMNIKVVYKYHKNMLGKSTYKNLGYKNTIDMSLHDIDPQELLFITDVLITDYSSCYVDFLLLNRPVIFYLYDNYEKEDNELYFKPQDHGVGPVAFNEAELLECILRAHKARTPLIEYNTFSDGKSCDRIYRQIRGTNH